MNSGANISQVEGRQRIFHLDQTTKPDGMRQKRSSPAHRPVGQGRVGVPGRVLERHGRKGHFSLGGSGVTVVGCDGTSFWLG